MPNTNQNDPVAALRRQVDLSPYSFGETSPRWLLALTRYLSEDLGALAMLGPNGLNVLTRTGPDRVRPDALALCIAALASCSRQTGKHIALGLPPGARHLPLVIAAVSVLADALQRAQASASGAFINANLSGVLVVSTDLDIRSRYCDLRVKDEALDNAFPGSRMRPTGEQIPLRSTHQNGIGRGVCFFLPPTDLPRPTFRPALAILDLRYGRLTRRAQDIVNWACSLHQQTEVLAIYTIGDRDTADALSNAQFQHVPIDHAALAACAELKPPEISFSALDCNLIKKSTFLKREHEILAIEDPETESMLISARQMIEGQRGHEGAGLNRARWILATLSHMPVPLVWYEQTARNLGRSTIRRLADRLAFRYDSGTGAAMQALKMQFDAIQMRMQGVNPIAEQFRRLLPDIVQEAGETLILVRDKVFQRALQNWLDVEAFPNAKWLRNVEIRACADYAPIATQSYPLVLINGTLPRRYRWIAGAALGDLVKYLAYPSEIDAIEHQLQDVYGEVPNNRRADERERSLCGGILPVSTQPLRLATSRLPKLELKKPAIRPKPTKEKPTEFVTKVTDFQSLATALDAAKAQAHRAEKQAHEEQSKRREGWEESSEEDLQDGSISEAVIGEGHADDIPCFRFEIQSRKHGHGFIWLPPEQTVECLRKSGSGDSIERIAAKELTAGDFLIIIEEDTRGSLFDRIVQIAEDQPDLQYLASYRKQWQKAMRILESKYECNRYGYTKLHADLRSNGSTIMTSVSVANWVLGRVMAPDDPSSIRAAGRLAGMDALDRDAKDFDRAFRTIRAIHQALGRRLSRLIRQSSRYVADPEEAATKETADDHIWLPVNELLETIDLAEIIARMPETTPINPAWVGRFVQPHRT